MSILQPGAGRTALLTISGLLVLVLALAPGILGQQAPRARTVSSGESRIHEGYFRVRLHLDENEGGREGRIELEPVRRIEMGEQWVRLEIDESDEITGVLNIPRENVLYLKHWALEDPEQR